MMMARMKRKASSLRKRGPSVVLRKTLGSRVRGNDGRKHLTAPVVQQRGVVLFIALIVMVAMSLAAIALIRSVDTTSQVIGNLAFRQASILPANFAIEDAAAGLFNDVNPANLARIADVRLDTPAENYYATHSQAAGWDDQYGVPQPLQTKVAAQ